MTNLMSSVERNQDRAVWIAAVLTFLFALVLYTVTMCRTVFWWDSGELAANASILGIPHRPGFPIFVLLARVFGLVPAGGYFARVTFLSVLCAAATAGVVTFALLRLIFRRVRDSRAGLYAVLLAVGALVLTFTFWIQAVRTEVYALNALIVALLVLLFAQADEAGGTDHRVIMRSFYGAAFLFGLGLGGHHATLAATAPAFAVLAAVILRRRVFHPGFLIAVLTLVSLGASIYLYLPIRAAQGPLLNWGWDSGSLAEGAQSVIATDAFGFLAQTTLAKAANNFGAAALLLVDQVGRPLTLLAVLGFFVWFAKAPRWAWFFLSLMFGNLLLLSVMVTDFIDWNADLHGYLLPTLIALVFGLAGGFWLILEYTSGLVDRAINATAVRLALKTALAGVSVLLALTPGVLSVPFCNLSGNRLADDLGRETLAGLPRQAVVIMDGVNWDFVLRGLQFAAGVRPDVSIIDRSLLPAPWYQRQCLRLYPDLFTEISFPTNAKAKDVLAWAEDIRGNDRQVFWEFTERELPFVGQFAPAGHLFCLVDADSTLADSLVFAQEQFERDSRFYNAIDQIRFDLDAQGMYIRNLYRAGLYYERRGLLYRARELYRRALSLRPDEGTLRAALERVEGTAAISSDGPSR